MELHDVIFKINNDLINKGYADIRIVPFQELEDSIKNYLTEKLEIEKSDNETIESLMIKLANNIPENKREFNMAKLTHYLLNILSLVQGYEMVWHIDEEAKQPFLKYSEYFPDKYDSLVTSSNFNYYETFQVVLDKLQEYLPIESRGRIV